MELLIFFVCLAASAAGGICGIGGGVIIKPMLDALGVRSVSAISFLSGLTVLSMSVISVFRQRKARLVELGTGSLLAAGAVAGGIAGNAAFQAVKTMAGSDRFTGVVQALVLALVTLLTLVYSAGLRGDRRDYGIAVRFFGDWRGPRQSGGVILCLLHGYQKSGGQLPVHYHVLPVLQLPHFLRPGDHSGLPLALPAPDDGSRCAGRYSGLQGQQADLSGGHGQALCGPPVRDRSHLSV